MRYLRKNASLSLFMQFILLWALVDIFTALTCRNIENSIEFAFYQKIHPTLAGLGAIAKDEDALENAPKIGALILFEPNSAKIMAQSIPLLRAYGKALRDVLSDVILIIAGHTDSMGDEIDNLELSRRRAEAVKEFFVTEYSLEPSRFLIKAYGESQPIEENDTEEGRAKNRRVEFIRVQ